jgi:hypothetical protein
MLKHVLLDTEKTPKAIYETAVKTFCDTKAIKTLGVKAGQPITDVSKRQYWME